MLFSTIYQKIISHMFRYSILGFNGTHFNLVYLGWDFAGREVTEEAEIYGGFEEKHDSMDSFIRHRDGGHSLRSSALIMPLGI